MTAPAKHTPGPLEVREEPEARVYVVVPAIPVGSVLMSPPRQPRPERRIARVYGDTYSNTVANAHLIAAAPDILAVLRRVRDFWAGGDCPQPLWDDICAAIARAEGGQS